MYEKFILKNFLRYKKPSGRVNGKQELQAFNTHDLTQGNCTLKVLVMVFIFANE